jgi:putative endonuclease
MHTHAAVVHPRPSVPSFTRQSRRRARGAANQARGRQAEGLARAALERDGWTVLGDRVRTPAGEIDLIAERDGLLGFIEVKCRPTLAEAAAAVTPRQQARLLQAGEILLGQHPHWGRNGVRFDLLVVDQAGTVRRIANAFWQQ